MGKASLAVMVGAALGAWLRYAVALWASARWGGALPWATLLVNVAGSFLLGALLALAESRVGLGPSARLLWATGFCGSLTTFSTFSYEALSLFLAGQPSSALLYMGGSLLAGLLAVALGLATIRLLLG